MNKKLKHRDGLKDILDKYDKYIDFQYRAVINIWSSLGVKEKLKFVEHFKDFLTKLKEIKEKYYKAQKLLYNGMQKN